jgi:hypothetical protein
MRTQRDVFGRVVSGESDAREQLRALVDISLLRRQSHEHHDAKQLRRLRSRVHQFVRRTFGGGHSLLLHV